MENALTRLRPFNAGDIEEIAKLVARARSCPPVAPPTPDELLTRWKRYQCDLEGDIMVLPGLRGGLIAYFRASLSVDPTRRIVMELAVYPELRHRGIGSALYKKIERKAYTLRAPHITTPLFVAADESRPENAGFLEKRGFFSDRSYVQMRLDHLGAQPRPKWPDGISFRRFGDATGDPERWAEMVRVTFVEPATAERVLVQLSETGSSPQGYLFAVDGKTGMEVGTCRARIDLSGGEKLGYVGTVGVLPKYRGRGIAQALILQTLQYLAEQGVRSAVLFVEASNHRARNLYDTMGWKPIYRTVHYWKRLPFDLGTGTISQ